MHLTQFPFDRKAWRFIIYVIEYTAEMVKYILAKYPLDLK